jgi:uncharacterized protein (TIGR03083 family)
LAGSWTIKDVASHLLDGNLRAISMYRDNWMLPSTTLESYRDLVDYLNRLNGEWVNATRRLSPNILVEWLETSHEAYVTCLEKLDPHAPSAFSVAWAGESVSTNAFHIAREYTEKWHHQQQIREALSNDDLLTREFYHPVLDTFLMALPHAYRNTPSPVGTRVSVHIDGDAGGNWTIERGTDNWQFSTTVRSADNVLTIPGDLAWKLFTKAVSPEVASHQTKLSGDEALARPALEMLTVMALR